MFRFIKHPYLELDGLQVHPAIGREQNDFADAMPETLRGGDFDWTVRCRRCVGKDAIVGEHFFHAEEMETVTDHEGGLPTLGLQQAGCGSDAVICGSAALLRYDVCNVD